MEPPVFRTMSKQRTIVSVALTGRDLLVLWVRNVFITARKRSCGKVMFLHLSVILFIGGGEGRLALGPGGVPLGLVGHTPSPGHILRTHTPDHTPPSTHTPLDTPSHTPHQHTLWTLTPITSSLDTLPPPNTPATLRSTSRRYASY